MWSHSFSFFLVAFPAIFTIVNPLSTVGPFLAMTSGDSTEKKHNTAQRACMVAAIVLVGCAAIGSFAFDFFSITVPALRIAGGLVLFSVAIDMVNVRESRAKSTAEEREEGAHKADIAIFPLAIPLLCGPGSMVSVVLLGQRAQSIFDHSYIFLSILVTMGLSYLVLTNAKYLARLLGATGINVMGRLMGLILASIAVQFVITGVSDAFPGLSHLGPG